MFKTKLRVGDTVVVTAGSSKGKSGKIESIDLKNQTVVVEGLNERKKHAKPSQLNPKGGIFKISGPIPISNVGIQHPTKKTETSKIAIERTKTGVKRMYAATKKEIK